MMRRTILLGFLLAVLRFVRSEEDEGCKDPNPPDACPFPENLDATNVALNAKAIQSTDYTWKGEAELAVDGNVAQKYTNLSCSHTSENGEERFPWLRIDFGSPHLIKNVKLYSRIDNCCAGRYHDIEVRVGNNEETGLGKVFENNGLCDAAVGGGYEKGHIFELTCVPCLAGRYLSVQIVKDCVNCDKILKHNVLSLCEVEAFGYPV